MTSVAIAGGATSLLVNNKSAAADPRERAITEESNKTVCTVQSASPATTTATLPDGEEMPEKAGYETIAANLSSRSGEEPAAAASPAATPQQPKKKKKKAIAPDMLDSYGFIRNMDAHGNWEEVSATEMALPTFAESARQERRISKWNVMLTTPSLERFRRRRAKLVTKRLRKGVPHVSRQKVWVALGKVPEKIKAHPGLYDKLVRDAAFGITTDKTTGETVSHGKAFQKVMDTIERDIHRTFPRHGMFYDDCDSDADADADDDSTNHQNNNSAGLCDTGEISDILRDLEFAGDDNKNGAAAAANAAPHPDARTPESVIEGRGGQASLRRVLRAYSLYDTEIGYCQGMNFIVGMFLTIMSEEEAFWLLVATMHDEPCKMRGMFAEGMGETHKVLFVAEKLIHQFLPKLAKHMDKENIHVTMYATQWLLTQYSSSFRFDLVTRVWDCFLGEGWKPTYRVMLAMLQHFQPTLLRMSFEEILAFMRELPDRVDGALICDNAVRIPLRRSHIAKYERQWRAQQQEQQQR